MGQKYSIWRFQLYIQYSLGSRCNATVSTIILHTSVLFLVSSSTFSQSILDRWMAPDLIWFRMVTSVELNVSTREELEMQTMAYGVRISDGNATN